MGISKTMACMLLIMALAVSFLSDIPIESSVSATALEPFELPIMVTYDLHADPLPQIPLDQRRNVYVQWRGNAGWLIDFLEPFGGKVTFLSVGEFMEFVLEDEADGIPLMRQLYESGGSIGSHSHTEHFVGAHNWPSFSNYASEERSRKSWDDVIRFVNAVAVRVIGSNDAEAVASVNNIRGSHLPKDRETFYRFMAEYEFPIQEGGSAEPWSQYFGHYVFNPFRPAIESPWRENLSTPFVYVPSGPVIGRVGEHAGVYQDFSLPNAKKMFLMLYLNWRFHETSPDSDRTWTFGWASHNHDISPGSQTRRDIEEFVKWMNSTFISKRSASGNIIATWAGRKEVYDTYVEWEDQHPGQSSFNYPADGKDYSLYPYLKPVQQALEKAHYVAEVTTFNIEGVYAHKLVSLVNGRPIYVLWKDDGLATVDLSSEFSGSVKVTGSISGTVNAVDAHAVTVGSEAAIVEEARSSDYLPTDVNIDGVVNIMDVSIVAKAYGSHGPNLPNLGDPPSSNWNVVADLNVDKWINILDITLVARDYGKTV